MNDNSSRALASAAAQPQQQRAGNWSGGRPCFARPPTGARPAVAQAALTPSLLAPLFPLPQVRQRHCRPAGPPERRVLRRVAGRREVLRAHHRGAPALPCLYLPLAQRILPCRTNPTLLSKPPTQLSPTQPSPPPVRTSVKQDPKVTADRAFNGFGTNFEGSPEPIYGNLFLPRKFKIAVTGEGGGRGSGGGAESGGPGLE